MPADDRNPDHTHHRRPREARGAPGGVRTWRRSAPDLRARIGQILGLTKLNWASTDSLCAEPITTKYTGDVAYLTAAFMRQEGSFGLQPVLERTLWFIRRA